MKCRRVKYALKEDQESKNNNLTIRKQQGNHEIMEECLTYSFKLRNGSWRLQVCFYFNMDSQLIYGCHESFLNLFKTIGKTLFFENYLNVEQLFL